MPFCKTCGTFYTKSLGICPQCNADSLLTAAADSLPAPPQEPTHMRLRRWLGLCIGIIALIAIIYAMYYIRLKLQQ